MTHPVPQPPRRLTRSRDERIVSGVCGGIARYFNIDPSLVRILAVLLTVLVSGVPLLLYVVASCGPRGRPGQPAAPAARPGPHGLAARRGARPRPAGPGLGS